MIPTLRLILLATAWTAFGALASAMPSLVPFWGWSGVGIAALLIIDALVVLAFRKIDVERRLPKRFALGEENEVRLILGNTGIGSAKIQVFDGIPQRAEAPAMPWTGDVPAGREIKVFHPVKIFERGEMTFTRVRIRRRSLLGLWQRQSAHGTDEMVKVYPNYEPVIRFAMLGMQHRESPLGIVRRPRAGTSRDFHQLRDYRDGDPFSQIDWKASSRRQMLISRDYQEQRDQTVVFLIDTGRRMRAMDGDLPQFDHALNAVLLVSHIALKQGDQVGVKSFGGTDRWLPPVKGAHAMPVILNHLYDYQTTSAPSDFAGAVEHLMARQRRRALVVVLTNLRGEDGKELIGALEVLKTRHVVMLASLKEKTVEDSASDPVEAFSGALRFLAADRYRSERREILAALGMRGILTLDTTAQEFAVALANRYLDVKAAGRI
ncbi:MAG TPA: DUF58 domain-containing protein [Luteolibacter sp.]|nr:DUF58 domain-containing protein [Luteolibacter sp.]